MSRCFAVLLVTAVVCQANSVVAQTSGSQFTTNQLRNIQRQNSTANYTSQNLRAQVFRQSIPQYAFGGNVNRNVFSSLSGKPLSKPFSNAAPRPGVSPYLGLSSPYTSSAENYYTQVRPRIEQQRFNQQIASRNIALQHQLNKIASLPPLDPKGNAEMMPTGHQAVYMNYGGYYPETSSPRR